MKEISYKDPYEPMPVIVQLEDDDAEGIAEILHILDENTRQIQNMERKEQYHTAAHLEGLAYEGKEYAAPVDIEEELSRQDESDRIDVWLRRRLTEVQYRRFCLFMEGMPIREISRQEGADYSSVNESIKAAQKKLQKICQDTPSEVPFKSPYYGK